MEYAAAFLPQAEQISMSMLNTPCFRRRARVIEARHSPTAGFIVTCLGPSNNFNRREYRSDFKSLPRKTQRPDPRRYSHPDPIYLPTARLTVLPSGGKMPHESTETNPASD